MDSIKQQQVASLLQQALSEVFLYKGREWYGGAFVTITQVRMTPDLMTARFYLSVYNLPDKNNAVDLLTENKSAVRHQLGNKIRNKVRRIPELEFYLDDTLDEVFKMEALFEKIRKENESRPNETDETI